MQQITNDDDYVPIDWNTAHPTPLNLWGPASTDDYVYAGIPILAPTPVGTRQKP
jgi:hypothetical protein